MTSPILLAHSLNSYCCLLFGTILNALLAGLVNFHSKGDLRQYRWAYYYFCALNMLLLCLHAFVQPVHIVTKTAHSFMATNGIGSLLSNNLAQFVMVIAYLSCLNNIIISLALQFFDRYLLICKKLDNRIWRISILVFMNLLILAIMLVSLLTYFEPTAESIENFPELFDILTADDLDQIKLASEFDQSNRVKSMAATMLMCSMLFCYLLVVFCFLSIRRFLKSHLPTNGFHSNVKLIKEISVNLLFQAILPLFCQTMVIVSILLRMTQHFSPGLLQFEMFTTIPYCWLPVLNPLITIITIRDYWNGMRSFIAGIGRQSSSSNVQSYENADGPNSSNQRLQFQRHHQLQHQFQLQPIEHSPHRLSVNF